MPGGYIKRVVCPKLRTWRTSLIQRTYRKEVSVEGTGACRHTEYSFKTGKVEFSLDDDVSCIEGNPPANAVGNLNILINGELKNHYYCFKQ